MLLLQFIALFCASLLFLPVGLCFNHWVVTEDGKIEYQVASPFNLRQPYDLMALIQQERRVSLLKDLKEELIDYKQEFEFYSGFETFDESYRASDPECRNVKFISSYDLTISTVLPLKHKGIDFLDHLVPMVNPPPAEPHCTLTPLEFSMWAMEHLEGMQGRRGLVAPPEKSVLSEVDMRLEVLGSLVHHALNKNSSSWVLLNLASLYWRARGNPYHALECIRRALHYSPRYSLDIALLNLANVLHRSRHSQDALVALRVAVDLSPSISVLQYALGNVYAALEVLNSSADCYKRCMELDYMGEVCQEMFLAATCEHRMEQASKMRNEKLDETQKKLDLFYSNMDLVKQQQAMATAPPTSAPVPTTKASKGQDSRKKDLGADGVGLNSKVKRGREERAVRGDGTRIEARSSQGKLDLERALDQALNESEGSKRSQQNQSNKSDKEGSKERTRPNFRLVLKPLPPEELENNGPPTISTATSDVVVHCFDEAWQLFYKQSPNLQYEELECEEDEEEELESNSGNSLSEILMLDKIEQETPLQQPHVDLSKLTPRREYPKDLYLLEFLPYHPLPDVLEEVMFPSQEKPLPSFHDPYWPRKRECLDLVREMKNTPGIVRYTGTFITPEARGANINELFASVSASLPYEMRRKPDCSKIVELPLSMVAMDHLEPIMYRANFRSNLHTGEKGLRKVVIGFASATLGHELTFEESGERVYAAMMKHGTNWALFDIASLYWRVRGDPTQSIECLRRAVHFAPRGARDVGYVGLANVLLRQNFLNEAVIMARAALDIGSNSPVAHYTLAHVYLGLRDYVAASLHLRAALQAQPVFSQALSALRMARCSIKFNEERQFLRQKTKEEEKDALRRQEAEIMDTIKDVVKTGKVERRSQPAMVIENKEPPEIPEMSMGEMADSPFTGEDAVRYLVRLALENYKGKLTRGGRRTPEMEDREEASGDSKQDGGRVDGVVEKEHVEESVGELQGSQEGALQDRKEDNKEPDTMLSTSDSGRANSGLENGDKVETVKKKTKKKKKNPKKGKRVKHRAAAEAIRRAKLQELDKETRQIIKEAAEALNRNQTPVLRRSTPKVYRLPTDEDPIPLPGVEEPSTTDTLRTSTTGKNKESSSDKRVRSADKPSASTEDNSKSGTSRQQGKSEEDKINPETASETEGKKNVTDSAAAGSAADKDGAEALSSGSKRPPQQQNNLPLHRLRKTREQIREEEMRRRFPERRPWPTLEECEDMHVPKSVVFTSTWLSVTAKGIKVKDYVDFTTPINPHHTQLPYCHNDFEQSEKTLSHLTGMNHHPLIQYKAEKGLQEVLCSLDGMRRPLEEVATRIKLAMDSNTNSWVLSNLAALYWRIVGQGQLAIKCLKHALYYSDENAKDVALVSLSNVLYRSGFDIDAAVVIHMSLEFSPTLVVNHFTMANILAAQGLFVEAAGFYDSTLQYQPEFQPAADRLGTVRCLLLFAKKNSRQKPAPA